MLRIRNVAFLIFCLLTFFSTTLTGNPSRAENNNSLPPQIDSFMAFKTTPATQSNFVEKLAVSEKILKPQVKFEFDQNLDFGKIKTIEVGEPGKEIITLKEIFWRGKKFSRQIISQEVKLAKPKVILVGRKKEAGKVQTPQGISSFFARFGVFATSYDKNCRGCNETTATGARTGFGVIAVDPQVIPLGTRIYVPGYGIGVAGDTGGAVKGNIIDLGFDDVKSGWWRSRFVDIYLLE